MSCRSEVPHRPRHDRFSSTRPGITQHLNASQISLLAGRALPGPDAEASWNDLAFALPANADKAYCKRKQPRIKEALGEAALIWEAE